MEIPEITIKQEKDNFTLTAEANEHYETRILDLMDIKEEPVKLEPVSDISEPNNFNQASKLSEEVEIVENNNKHVLAFLKSSELVQKKNLVPNHEKCQANSSKKKRRGVNFRCKYNMYKCDQCDYQTVHKGSLKRHGLKHLTPDQSNGYKCDQCNFQTVWKNNLKGHSLKHIIPDEGNWYRCNQCNYQTVRKDNLKQHSLKHIISDEGSRYKCNQCDYQTVRKANFKRHGLKHLTREEGNWYKCDQCNFQTVHKRNIQQHVLQHKSPNEVDMYKCDQCKYQTIHKHIFKRHELKHLTSKPNKKTL